MQRTKEPTRSFAHKTAELSTLSRLQKRRLSWMPKRKLFEPLQEAVLPKMRNGLRHALKGYLLARLQQWKPCRAP